MSLSNPLIRFAITGTLIALYGLVDHHARRLGGEPLRRDVRPPRWVTPLIFVSILAFYSTIRPFGGPLLGGWGNAAGIVLAFGAAAFRWYVRLGHVALRQPDVAARMWFYTALPLAAGVWSGWLTLTVPALLASAYCCLREDALLRARLGKVWDDRIAHTHRWVPGIW